MSAEPARREAGARALAPRAAWRAASALPLGVHDPGFTPLIQRIMRGPVHAVPAVQVFTDGEQAFAAMQQAVASATVEILLEAYIVRDDAVGAAMHQALAAAVQRGVRVCVLADAVGSLETHDAFWDRMAADGITVRLFHRFRHLPFELLRRDHRKIVVIDRQRAFIGGMNIGVEYGSSIRSHAHAWRDTMVLLTGSVARELAAVFAEGWDRAQGPPLPGLEYVSWDAPTEPEVDPDLPAIPRPSASAQVLDARPGRRQREVLTVLACLVGAARTRLWITTPYFAPPSLALAMLRHAALRGVDVRLLLPGHRADIPFIRHAAHATYAGLLRAGVRIIEYEQATLHAKTLVVDGRVTVAGSTNLDSRSFWWNAECNVLLTGAEVATGMEHDFLEDCARGTVIDPAAWAARPWWHRLGDWAARTQRWAL